MYQDIRERERNNFIFWINFTLVHLLKAEPFAYCYGNAAAFTFKTQGFYYIFSMSLN